MKVYVQLVSISDIVEQPETKYCHREAFVRSAFIRTTSSAFVKRSNILFFSQTQ